MSIIRTITRQELSDRMFEIADMVEEVSQKLKEIREKTMTLEDDFNELLNSRKEQPQETTVANRKRRKQITQREIANVIGLYKNGAPTKDIMKVTDLSQPSVSRILKCFEEANGGFVSVSYYQEWQREKYGRKI
jgi:uncharacterized protein YerC